MKSFAFRPGVCIRIDASQYILIQKVTGELWQLEESLTGVIRVFACEQLQKFYVNGRLVLVSSTQKQAETGLPTEWTEIDQSCLDVYFMRDKKRQHICSASTTTCRDRFTCAVLHIRVGLAIPNQFSGRV